IPDLIVTEARPAVQVLLGNGDGTFRPLAPANLGFTFANPYGLAVADLDRDGRLDAGVSVDGPQHGVLGLPGRGGGTFGTARFYATGISPMGVAVGDFDGDGTPDLAVVNFTNPNGTVSVLLGVGDGTFRPAVNYFVGVDPTAVTVGDFNGDGILDLA